MRQEISVSNFRNQFNDMRPNSFSYDGLGALYDFFEEVDPDMELDIVGIDCDFCEYSSAIEAVDGYNCPLDCEDEDDNEKQALEFLHDNTIVLQFTNGIIIQNF